MAKKQPKVVMDKDTFSDFIWMSYRYCIGRKTIAACMHADTIARTIISNPDLISEDRMIFNAKDIRSNVTDCIRFKKSLVISGYKDDVDVFSSMLYALNGIKDVKKHKFTFNIQTGEFSSIEECPTMYEFDYPDSDYMDLIPWVKLANWMDKRTHRNIIVNFDGEISEKTCYPYPIQHRNEDGTISYEEVWDSVENPSIDIHRYISKEYILKINK